MTCSVELCRGRKNVMSAHDGAPTDTSCRGLFQGGPWPLHAGFNFHFSSSDYLYCFNYNYYFGCRKRPGVRHFLNATQEIAIKPFLKR
jgi:hypothetical protein